MWRQAGQRADLVRLDVRWRRRDRRRIADGIHGCAPDLQVTGPATLYQNTQILVWSKRDLQAFARNDQPPLDEPNDILVAPRLALSVAYVPGVVAETVCADLRVGFTRCFNPRAPPSPQA